MWLESAREHYVSQISDRKLDSYPEQKAGNGIITNNIIKSLLQVKVGTGTHPV